MIEAIDHVAIKVPALGPISDALCALGFVCKDVRTFDDVGLEIAFLSAGSSHLELLEVVSAASPIRNDPMGIQHLALAVPDIEACHRMLASDDRFEVQSGIQKGAHARIFFFRIKACGAVSFECVEARR